MKQSPRSRPRARQAAVAAVALALSLAAVLPGCSALPFQSAGSELAVRSQSHEGVRLRGDFTRAIYGFDDRHNLTVVLLEGPEDAPAQAAVLRMFWRPAAGKTPISSNATNATVQYLVFAPDAGGGDQTGEVGVYSGAGFLYPQSDPGAGTLRAGVWQATLRLADRSTGFDDRLGKAVLSGDLTARRDDAAVEDTLRRLAALVTDRLGYPRLVAADAPADAG